MKLETNFLEEWSRDKAQELFPGLTLLPTGSEEDRRGTDGYLNNRPVQLKMDIRISGTGNVYHEIYEKTKGNPNQLWRHSPQNAHYYIFMTGDHAILTNIDYLAMAEQDKTLRKINDTSLGFLLKEDLLDAEQTKYFITPWGDK